jgi:hypothetical protein
MDGENKLFKKPEHSHQNSDKTHLLCARHKRYTKQIICICRSIVAGGAQ